MDVTTGLEVFWRSAALLAVPLLYVVAAMAAGAGWRWSRLAATGALAGAVLSALALALAGPLVTHGPLNALWGGPLGLRMDTPGAVVLLLVTLVGWVIVRYSASYLAGDAAEARYRRWLMLTLAAVSMVVLSNHLGVLALAWLATSLALHRLLTHFGHRRQAQIAAHKKFLISRLADVCLLVALGLLVSAFGTLDIDRLLSMASAADKLPAGATAAVLLIVCAALLKCAQLPAHGWLIQVMEAPTPVSALLHAGIVNLGGFVLIRLSPLVSEVSAAMLLLVVAGTLTAVVAALVMTTRISIKVMLAWSTCAQMGFMLLECGLGAWDLALLHLVAHSLYKAHAFLGAGGAVAQSRLQQLSPALPVWSAPAAFGAALVGAGLASWLPTWAGQALGLASQPVAMGASLVLVLIMSLALVPLLLPLFSASAWQARGALAWRLLGGAAAVAAAYAALHHGLSGWAGAPVVAATGWQLGVVLLGFGALFVVQGWVRAKPGGALAARLYPWFYGGLFLDELFTRLTFRLWPAPRVSGPASPLVEPLTGAR
jgi:NAD(P)H-quinone oxidoreductase subunit 5